MDITDSGDVAQSVDQDALDKAHELKDTFHTYYDARVCACLLPLPLRMALALDLLETVTGAASAPTVDDLAKMARESALEAIRDSKRHSSEHRALVTYLSDHPGVSARELCLSVYGEVSARKMSCVRSRLGYLKRRGVVVNYERGKWRLGHVPVREQD